MLRCSTTVRSLGGLHKEEYEGLVEVLRQVAPRYRRTSIHVFFHILISHGVAGEVYSTVSRSLGNLAATLGVATWSTGIIFYWMMLQGNKPKVSFISYHMVINLMKCANGLITIIKWF